MDDTQDLCYICYEKLQHPLTLPCNHYFCYLCVKGIYLLSFFLFLLTDFIIVFFFYFINLNVYRRCNKYHQKLLSRL